MTFAQRKFPPGFRARRGLNWGVVGLMYTSYYLCRYNLPLANKAIADEFHFSKSDMSSIISAQLLAYAIGQIVNGLLTDRLGGKRAMLIGAAGTVTMNLLFGASSFWGFLWLFVVLRSIDGYVQAFGAPGFIKINAAWFGQTERGTFAGIFGFMINLGRLGINYFGAALLAGFTFLGMWQVPALHWRWLFWIPAGVASLVAVVLALVVKDTPEEAGFAGVHAGEADHSDTDVHGEIATVFKRIVGNPLVWIIALAYACTGAVRQCIDQWFPRYFQEVYHLELSSARFQWLGFLIPFVASSGSLISGIISDRVFQGRRAPVAAWIYFIEVCVILVATQVQSLNWALVFFVLISFTANSTHSLLGPAAAMDIGGRKMAGFASGVIDSFQYFGASLALKVLGYFLDKSWDSYFYFMVPFGVIGGLLMFAIRNKALGKNNA
ncbi:MAG: MFS transporter [Verrucomicrobiota bacterium]|jgi:OPA family glycerol-3-phosphate transporter-like MFS transporter